MALDVFFLVLLNYHEGEKPIKSRTVFATNQSPAVKPRTHNFPCLWNTNPDFR